MLQRLSCLPLQSLARSSGFVIRRPRKLSLEAFLQSILLGLCQPNYSFQSWAAHLSALQSRLFSKQALHRRCGRGLVKFLELLLASLLGSSLRRECCPECWQHFGRVLLQDSTALALHPALAQYFPACGNQHQRSLASLKIQAVFEVSSQRWLHFELGALTDNDQKASALILSHLQPGDLLIRDLGYAVFEVWRQIMARDAYFLSRCRADFRLFEPHTRHPLDLLAVLQNQAQISRQVLLGVEELLPVRLVALRLPAALAAQRRRRARANARRDSALRLSQRYLKLLEWTILLTNVPDDRLSAQQVLEFYSCRWQIEVLFKSWKSQFRIGRLPASNPLQVQIQLLARLLAITLLQNLFSPNLMAPKDSLLSPLKTAAYFSALLPLIAACPYQNWFDHFLYFCRYDSRHDRANFFQKLSSLC